MIQDVMDRLCARLEHNFVGTDRVLNINDMWGCYTSESISEYAFGRRYHFIDSPDFRADFTDALVGLNEPVHYVTHFAWFFKVLMRLPNWVIKLSSSHMAAVSKFNRVRIHLI